MLGNAVIGGIAGAAIDTSNGSMRDLTPNPVSVELIAVEKNATEKAPVAQSAISASSPSPAISTDKPIP